MATPVRRAVANHNFTDTWTLTTADAVGEEITRPHGSDMSVQVIGTFGGGTVTVQGSNIENPAAGAGSSDWQTLHDEIGNELTFIAEGKHAIAEACEHMRVQISSSTGATVTVAVFSRRSF